MTHVKAKSQTPEHTPGPWGVFEHRDHSGLCIGPKYNDACFAFTDGEVRDVCTIRSAGRFPTDEQQANALLIAAAPELLAALEGLLKHHDHNGMVSDAGIVARAAVAKAKSQPGGGK